MLDLRKSLFRRWVLIASKAKRLALQHRCLTPPFVSNTITVRLPKDLQRWLEGGAADGVAEGADCAGAIGDFADAAGAAGVSGSGGERGGGTGAEPKARVSALKREDGARQGDCLPGRLGPPFSGMGAFFLRLFVRLIYWAALRMKMVGFLRGFFPLWSVSNAIYVGPAGPSATIFPEYVALKRITADGAITDAEIHRHLSHSNPWVVGYCFEALMARRSRLLEDLPEGLLERQEKVTMGAGCYRLFSPLSEYIRGRLKAERIDSRHVETR